MKNKLPIGIQGFAGLRNDGYLYVDKTEYIYKAVHSGKQYFLSRPRRFGKSLLLSAFRAYWEGRRDLFKGLAIEELEQDDPEAWKPVPVFYLDLNRGDYRTTSLEQVLENQLTDWEEVYGDRFRDRAPGERFQKLLEMAAEQSGQRCVVMVDEYDKPLLDVIDDPETESHNRDVFKGFFSALKSCDDALRFVFIAGVTKFSKVSIFSDLNQLRDISFSREFAGICGITDVEIDRYFKEEIIDLANRQGMTTDQCLAQLKKTYDGYCFCPRSEGVYNPFSLLNAFADGEFRSYWFATGTPTFLVKKIRESGFDVRKLSDRTLYASEANLSDYRAEDPDPVPLLYQTGYLTIADYDPKRKRYTLCFPNEEVEYGFLESLMPVYAPDAMPGKGTDIFTLEEYVEKGDTDGIRDVLTALFAGIPYTNTETTFEHYFQTVIYLVFTLLGQYVHCEMHTFAGRIDCVLETKDFVYLFEFKRDGSADSALSQIEEKRYALPYRADRRRVLKIGASFDSAKRILTEWKVQE